MNIVVLIEMDSDVVQHVRTFIGDEAETVANAAFQTYTGISYEAYQERRQGSEDDIDILGEEKAGTQIHVTGGIGNG